MSGEHQKVFTSEWLLISDDDAGRHWWRHSSPRVGRCPPWHGFKQLQSRCVGLVAVSPSFVPQDCSCAARALQQHNMNPGLGSLPPGPEQSSICEYFKADVVKRSLSRAVDVTPKKPIMVFRMIHLTLESWTVHSFFYHHRIVSSWVPVIFQFCIFFIQKPLD